MKVYRLHRTQDLPVDLETAWTFFSDPRNLSEITPPELGLTVLTEQLPERMHEGMIIRYTLHPFFASGSVGSPRLPTLKSPTRLSTSRGSDLTGSGITCTGSLWQRTA